MLINMNTTNRIYSAPEIKCIEFDNQISLQIESDAPIGPGESFSSVPEYFNCNPFISNNV